MPTVNSGLKLATYALPPSTRKLVASAAAIQGRTTGEVVQDAVLAHLRQVFGDEMFNNMVERAKEGVAEPEPAN